MAEDKLGRLKKKLDALNDKPDKGVSGRKKVDILTDLASEVVLSDCGAAEDYARRAVELAESMDYHKGGATSYRLLGLSYEYRARYEETLDCYQKALSISRKIGDKRGVGKALLNIGGIYLDLGHFDKALKYQMKALRYFEEVGNKRDIAGNYINIGAAYQHLKNFEQGAEYNIKALKIFEKIKHAEGIADAASNIGGCYAMLGNHERAFKYAIKALSIYGKLGETFKTAQILLIIGTIYGEKNDNKRALTYYTQALSNYEKVEAKKGIAYACNNIGEIERRLGNYDSSFVSLQRALKTAQEIKAIENEMESYELLSKLFEAQQNHQNALDYHKKYTSLREKIFNVEKSKQIADMRTRYETEQKEKEAEIYRLKNVDLRREVGRRKKVETELKKHRDQLENMVAKRTANLKAATVNLRKEIVQRERIEKELLGYQKQLRALAHELSLVEERQRRKIATGLHDNISQSLMIINSNLETLAAGISNQKMKKRLKEIQSQTKQMIQRTRSMTFEISPPVLYELGLEPALEWLAERFQEQHGVKCEFYDDGKIKPISEDWRSILFQSTRELLANVRKHAKAEKVRVSMHRVGKHVRITVLDDGTGFDPEILDQKIAKNEGFGLFNLRQQLTHLQGKFEIDSKKGVGTKVTLLAPLQRFKKVIKRMQT